MELLEVSINFVVPIVITCNRIKAPKGVSKHYS
nr:MAG TPA: hypothetical protein [Caudoviricetes sp.]